MLLAVIDRFAGYFGQSVTSVCSGTDALIKVCERSQFNALLADLVEKSGLSM
ncbi:hypothetical protein [Marinobacter salexigens]|uniref:Uncharacterized protein n=1 Tax=Marinobacter salexigens TaxID=1925763 RepID=A0ABS6A5W9_9GAMM|nr:hypothetical protein [Marinobacter salexigens]MBU2873159.1 hypothetical protein [Marinobacter salexigens]